MGGSYNLLTWWQNRAKRRSKALSFYEDIIKAARRPIFYGEYRLPDQADGRFESLALHLFLFYERAHRDPILNPYSRAMANLVTQDIEANLREMGAGDMYIGKKVKKTTLSLYSRLDSYWGYFHDGEQKIEDDKKAGKINLIKHMLFSIRNKAIHDEPIEDEKLQAEIDFFIAYIANAQANLKKQPSEEIIAKGPVFPEPIFENRTHPT